jgi:hypothetical protein
MTKAAYTKNLQPTGTPQSHSGLVEKQKRFFCALIFFLSMKERKMIRRKKQRKK